MMLEDHIAPFITALSAFGPPIQTNVVDILISADGSHGCSIAAYTERRYNIYEIIGFVCRL